jgi:hypothetical protein
MERRASGMISLVKLAYEVVVWEEVVVVLVVMKLI